ncbi:MAG: DNA translocase FtsK 4TM domain-containing protein [Holosporaceae bacterium]|nr:DNA translocase FtsK 4TM domain-containing protein [Holosporaceae bacterium]
MFSSRRHGDTYRNFIFAVYNRCVEFLGIIVFFVALSTIVATISYCPEDPSFNTAIDGPTSNLLSIVGSYYADAIVQFLGHTSYVFSLILLSFGYQLMKFHVVSFFRILIGIVCSITGATLLAILPMTNKAAAGVIGILLSNAIGSYVDFSVHHIFLPVALTMAGIFVGSFIFAVRFYFSHIKLLVESICHLFSMLKNKIADNKNPDEYTNIVVGTDGSPVPSSGAGAAEFGIKRFHILEKIQSKSSAQKNRQIPGGKFSIPPLSLLKESRNSEEKLSDVELKARSISLIGVLKDFGIDGEITGASPGPVVTLYELKPAAGIKSSRVIGLSNDIARYMSAVSARVAVIPGRNALGIELPNVKRQIVFLRELLESNAYIKSACALPISLGKDISGGAIVADLAKMPHLLIAGTTGSGKSVGINAMILSLLYRLSPDQCKFIMIDPKMLELSVYDDIPHLLTPVVTDPQKAIVALKWAVKEMESRYKAMSKLGVRNIEGYNFKIDGFQRSNEPITRKVHTGFDSDTGAPIYEEQVMNFEHLPYVVIIVDEMADLMLVSGKDIEIAVQRLAQMARAAGIHLIMATQRPSVDVITGTIKANFPTRISFQVSSKIDSRTILGEQGAEQLLGHGDMLYLASGGRMTRIHCPFVSDEEVEKIASYLKTQGEPRYITSILDADDETSDDGYGDDLSEGDPMYKEALALILREGKVSTSFIQRHLKLGYNRAARIVDMMEAAGIISAANHVGKREIIGR